MLGLSSVRQLMRHKEALYRELQLDNADLDEPALYQILADHPQLLECRLLSKMAKRASAAHPSWF